MTTTTTETRRAGRPTLPESEKLKNRVIRLTDDEWAFVQAVGGKGKGSGFIRSLIAMVMKGRKAE